MTILLVSIKFDRLESKRRSIGLEKPALQRTKETTTWIVIRRIHLPGRQATPTSLTRIGSTCNCQLPAGITFFQPAKGIDIFEIKAHGEDTGEKSCLIGGERIGLLEINCAW